jgi:hypothetical protein
MTSIRIVLALCAALFLLGACASASSDEEFVCGSSRNPERHDLVFKIKTTADGCVEKVKKKNGTDGTSIDVCRGDSVRWKVKVDNDPNGGKEKSVAFDKSTDSPFEWKDSGYQSDRIEGKVSDQAQFDTPYEYSVRTKGGPDDGCPLDPMIIVRH